MSFASMHNDYLDPDRHLWPEEQDPDDADAERKARKAGARMLRLMGAESWGNLYRRLYKGTDCGVTVGVQFAYEDKPVYCEDLYARGPDAWPMAVHISSIVEGVDQCTETHIVDLTKRRSWRRLWAAVNAVEREAASIWNETHGCDACAAFYGADLDGADSPVWPDCPECGGNGRVI